MATRRQPETKFTTVDGTRTPARTWGAQLSQKKHIIDLGLQTSFLNGSDLKNNVVLAMVPLSTIVPKWPSREQILFTYASLRRNAKTGSKSKFNANISCLCPPPLIYGRESGVVVWGLKVWKLHETGIFHVYVFLYTIDDNAWKIPNFSRAMERFLNSFGHPTSTARKLRVWKRQKPT